ncbi:MAG TPA: hypothetical protein ENJ59_01790, partial [Thermofilum sp.]|nr:hypothetical protein [Thermofilum sp.]
TVAVYSGHKGGTGKSTISVFLAIFLSLSGKSVMLLDLGGSIDFILEKPSPPDVSSLFLGEAEWYDAARYVKLGKKLAGARLVLIPFGGYVPPGISWNNVCDIIRSMNEFFDVIIIDLPADPAWTLTPQNVPVILVLDESPSSSKIAEKTNNLSNYFIVFNKCMGGRIKQPHGNFAYISFDKNIASLNPSNLYNVYLSSFSRVLRPLNSFIRDIFEVEIGGGTKWPWKLSF